MQSLCRHAIDCTKIALLAASFLPQQNSGEIMKTQFTSFCKFIRYVGVAAISMLLFGCGGGGGGGGGSGGGSAFPNVSSYVGTWVGICDTAGGGSNQATLTFTANNGQLVGSVIIKYFGVTGCTGTVLATDTYSASATLTYVSTVPALVVLSQYGTPSSIQVDQITASLPQGFGTVTGAGVTKVVKNGQPQWCFYYNSGSTCIHDNGVQAAKTVSGGLHTQGSQLFELDLVNGAYTVGRLYTKQ